MKREEIIELFIRADEETRKTVEKILSENKDSLAEKTGKGANHERR